MPDQTFRVVDIEGFRVLVSSARVRIDLAGQDGNTLRLEADFGKLNKLTDTFLKLRSRAVEMLQKAGQAAYAGPGDHTNAAPLQSLHHLVLDNGEAILELISEDGRMMPVRLSPEDTRQLSADLQQIAIAQDARSRPPS